MTDRHGPHDEQTADEAQGAWAPSLSRALAQWADERTPPLGPTFTDEVMAECQASERARAWGEDRVVPLPEDFAEGVLRAVYAPLVDGQRGLDLSAWSETQVPDVPEGFADRVLAGARADGQRADRPIDSRTENQVPLASADSARVHEAPTLRGPEPSARGGASPIVLADRRPRVRTVALALGSSLAAAAVALFALGPFGSSPPAPNPVATVRAVPRTVVIPPSDPAPVEPPRATPSEGSELEKIVLDGDEATFSSFSLTDDSDPRAVAVVWIEDGRKTSL
jgi:hypothetical protein